MNIIEQELDENGIFILRLNRPEKLNALNTELLTTLKACFHQAKVDKKIKAVLLTGNGKAFCAGADISRLAECDALSGYDFARYGQEVFRELETLPKPSLACVNGYAFGGGCELALSATLRFASTSAVFAQPEVKLGVIPGYGGTVRLSRLIGKGRALDLCLTGRSISASMAEQYGLVSAVVNPEELLLEGKRRLTSILTMAPLAINAVMQSIDRGYNLSLEDALDVEALCFAKLCASKDKAEGVAAFLEKRDPKFQGD
jgi:enoyl-CoA hydratase